MLASYPQGRAAQSRGTQRPIQVQAPIGGWNTRDALDAMPPTDAVMLDNWIPGTGSVFARGGYADLAVDMATTLGGSFANDPVHTLMTLSSGGTEKMLAAFSGGLARVDTGSPTSVKAAATYTVDRWQHTVFADSAAPDTPKIIAVNGTDAPWTWDGTTHAAWGASGTGLTLTDLVWVQSYKNRIYCGEAGSRNFWYGGLGAGAPTLTRFPLSGVRGVQGHILYMVPITRDTGSGADDFAAFVTSEGQVVIYAGTNPGGTADEWELVGIYSIPRPIQSRRSYAPLFGDAIIATELDYILLREAIQAGGGRSLMVPSKLTGAMQAAALLYRDVPGWEIVIAEQAGLLLSNVPLEEDTQYHQHVINIQTRAPARFTGWNFHTFGKLNGRVYAGGDGAVYQLFSGLSDDADATEAAIELRAQTAWQSFGAPGHKRVHAVRPIFRADGTLNYGAAVGMDYRTPAPVVKASSGPPGAATVWGDTPGATTLWGDTAGVTTYWAGTTTSSAGNTRQWRTLGGRGFAFALGLAMDVNDQRVEWLATDWRASPGGGF